MINTSKEWTKRASNVLVDGGSSAARSSLVFHPYPPYIDHGLGSKIFDIEGRGYIDWMMAFGALPLGHAHPSIVDTVRNTIETGSHFAAATTVEVELAELICKLVPAAEKVRFCNTGTEAVMAAVRLARGYTGRKKIIKFEGHYHGWSDAVLVSSNPQKLSSLGHPHSPVGILDSSGIPAGAVENTIVVPWNDIDLLERVMRDKGRDVACVMMEGVMSNIGVIPPKDGYLQEVEKLCKKYDSLFYLDETVTGFRLSPGGCAELFDIKPDIVSFGKALGQGFPLAAICGKADVMDGLSWGKVMHYGTLNACRTLCAVSLAGLNELSKENNAGFKKLKQQGNYISEELKKIFMSQNKHSVICQNVGSIFQIYFTEKNKIENFREYCDCVDSAKYTRFANDLRKQGVYVNPSNSLHSISSTVHSNTDIDETIMAVEKVLSQLN